MTKEFEKDGIKYFHLGNDNISLMLRVNCGQIELLHFGKALSDEDAPAMAVNPGPGWGCATLHGGICLDSIPLAWSFAGNGDYRELPLELMQNGKIINPDFAFENALHVDSSLISGLPAPKGKSECLKIVLRSEYAYLNIYYNLFETALCIRTELINDSENVLTVSKLMSFMMDIKGNYTMKTFDGGWISETHEHDTPVERAKVVNESLTGFSSNRHNPGFILYSGDDCYAFNLIYSGNHYASAQGSEQNFTRVMQGMNPESFVCDLNPGEKLEAPYAVVTFSPEGFNGVRHLMHKFVNEHIVPTYWQYRERPVLYNNWEGCMFDFTESKLLSLARKAKSLGCELFVLDDGWFGKRNSDTAGLGDYSVNKKKLPRGLEGLSRKLKNTGLDFGLWFEPEAVNPDSDLYRSHPEWAIEGDLGRNELLLDLRRADVRDYIVENVSSIIDRANIKYVKWDMNRHSSLRGYDAHLYVLGLYDVLRRIFSPRPEVLLEGCASGGNRFDLGMLSFAPQCWASDNTDPIERLDIKEGLSYLYPLSAMGCHISASAHIQTLRSTPLSTRANVSFFGIFGLELELAHLLPVEKADLKEAIAFYKENRNVFQFGEFSRVKSEKDATAWQVKDKDKIIVGVFHRLVHSALGYEWLCADADEKSVYDITSRKQYLRVGQFSSMIKHIVPFNLNPNGIAVRTADRLYKMEDGCRSLRCTGKALKSGIPMNLKFTGTGYDANMRNQGDFGSNVYLMKKSDEK